MCMFPFYKIKAQYSDVRKIVSYILLKQIVNSVNMLQLISKNLQVNKNGVIRG